MGAYRKFDEVLLSIGANIVASGTVHKVKPEDKCQDEHLGTGRIAVIIEASFQDDVKLPYPLARVLYVKDAVDSAVLWNIEGVRLKTAQEVVCPIQNLSSEGVTMQDIDGNMDVSILQPTTEDGVLGSEVQLLKSQIEVGRGIVFHVDPEKTCHNIIIGEGNISVSVLSVQMGFENDPLQFPHRGADTIGEAVGGLVKWSKVDVRKVCSIESNRVKQSHSNILTGKGNAPFIEDNVKYTQRQKGNESMVEDIIEVTQSSKGKNLMIVDDIEGEAPLLEENVKYTHRQKGKESMVEDDGTQSSKGKELMIIDNIDYTDRKNWRKQKVELFCPDREIAIAIGIILVFRSTDVVNEEQLGNENIGVTLIHVLRPEYFPNVNEEDQLLVRWATRCTKLMDDGRFLQDILDEAKEDSDDSTQVIPQIGVKKKRPYHFLKRSKGPDPTLQIIKDGEKRAGDKLTEEHMQKTRQKVCCSLECCHGTPLEDIRDIRLQYYGMNHDNRVTYVMYNFEIRGKDVIDNGMMVLRSRVVCKTAFWEIHGFSKASFYKKEKQYEAGVRVGFHGNQGRLKTKENTLLAHAHLEQILIAAGEPMPHLQYTGENGTDTIEYRLPSSMTKLSIYEQIKMAMIAKGLPPIVDGTFYKIWDQNFANYKIHNTSAFSKCDECCRLKEKLEMERRVKQRGALQEKRRLHLQEQMARRHIYYAARMRATENPDEYLCIIHDKMDQNKTWLPRMPYKVKSLGKHYPLPVSLTGMLTHGREPGAYAHYAMGGLWPSDPDFTITSLAKCLRDLEDYCGDKSGDLGRDVDDSSHPIFQAFLDQNAFKVGYLELKHVSRERFQGLQHGTGHNSNYDPNTYGFKPLPKHLFLQMDNSGKDNKNQFLLAFCSDLVARGHFETIIISFLMVGHTHEDIDAVFSKIAQRTKGKHISTLLELMAEVWECMAELHPVPFLIQEVAAYKDYLFKHKVKQIVGHSKPVAFKFSMKNGIPIYQWKPNNNMDWYPAEGRTIWGVDKSTNQLIVPTVDPLAKKMAKAYKKADLIVPYLNDYIKYLDMSSDDISSEAYRIKAPLKEYWRTIANHLLGRLESSSSNDLQNGFWPRTNHGTGYKTHSLPADEPIDPTPLLNEQMAELQEEYDEEIREQDVMFVGAISEKTKKVWNPLADIKPDCFVVVCPSQSWEDEEGALGRFWIVRSKGTVRVQHIDERGPIPCFAAEWWRPKNIKGDATEKQRYENCFSDTKTWECDPLYRGNVYEIDAAATMYSWMSRTNPAKMYKSGIKIPPTTLKEIEVHMDRYKEEGGSSTQAHAQDFGV